MVGGTIEVSTVFAELGVTKRQELIVTITNSDAVEKSPVDAGINFIISLLISRRVDSTLERLAWRRQHGLGVKPRATHL